MKKMSMRERSRRAAKAWRRRTGGKVRNPEFAYRLGFMNGVVTGRRTKGKR